MAEATSIRELYCVEVDARDWPLGLPDDEKKELEKIVIEVLREHGPMHMYMLYHVVGMEKYRVRLPVWGKCALLDWLYGCLARACRAADAEQHWMLPPEHPAMVGVRGSLDSGSSAASCAAVGKLMGMRHTTGLKTSMRAMQETETSAMARVLALRLAKDHPDLAKSIVTELAL